MSDGALIRKEAIGIKSERLADAGEPALDELITVENFEAWDAAFQLALTFEAGFEDVFAIRGLLPEKLGRSYEPEWKDGALRFVYEGADKLYRGLSVHFSPAPDSTEGTTARFNIRLRPAVVSSNPGHALWTGIAEDEKARRTMERLMTDDMFNGRGVRTLSGNERRYNPVGYHLGTVWPHDNSIIAAGFRRHGFDKAAMRISSDSVRKSAEQGAFRLI